MSVRQTNRQPLSTLARDDLGNDNRNSMLNLLLWFVGAFFVWLVVFGLWNPTWVQTHDATGAPTGARDLSKLIIFSGIAALLTLLVIYIVRSYNRNR